MINNGIKPRLARLFFFLRTSLKASFVAVRDATPQAERIPGGGSAKSLLNPNPAG